jgi:uncharacterized protein YukE
MGLLGDVFDAVGLGGVGDVVDVIKTSVEAVAGVVTEVHKQRDVVDDLVSKPLSAIVERVQAGEIWRGANAQKFIENCQKDFLTEAVHTHTWLDVFGGSVNNAAKAVADADLEAARMAEDLLTDADQAKADVDQITEQ